MLFSGSNSTADVCAQVSVVLKCARRHSWLHRIDEHDNWGLEQQVLKNYPFFFSFLVF